MLNNIVIEGFVENEPELAGKDPDTGVDIVKFHIANDKYKRNSKGETVQKTVFIDLQFKDELAHKVLDTIHKGMIVRAVGEIVMEDFDRTVGLKSARYEILCNYVELPRNQSFF